MYEATVSPTAIGWLVVGLCFAPLFLYLVIAALRRSSSRAERQRQRAGRTSHGRDATGRVVGTASVGDGRGGIDPDVRQPLDGGPARPLPGGETGPRTERVPDAS